MTLNRSIGIVTGASSGIGAAIAVELANEGMSLLLVGRDEGRLAETRSRALEAGAAACRALAVDLCDDSAAEQVIAEAGGIGEGIDVLVPCAGIFEPEPLDGAALAALDRHIAVNVRAPYALMAAATPHLRPGAAVVLVSSICGRVGFLGASAYCASKGAIEMLTRALARELAARDVRINAVAPGIIRTPLNAGDLDGRLGYAEQLVERTPLGRIGGPDEVAPAVRFLVSDSARFITGATLAIDGGWLAE